MLHDINQVRRNGRSSSATMVVKFWQRSISASVRLAAGAASGWESVSSDLIAPVAGVGGLGRQPLATATTPVSAKKRRYRLMSRAYHGPPRGQRSTASRRGPGRKAAYFAASTAL